MIDRARLAVLAGFTVGGFSAVAEMLCGCSIAAPEHPPTPQQRAERAAVNYLAEDGGEAWRSYTAEVSRETDGWEVFVQREPGMPGGHATVILDDDLNVVRHVRGR